MESSPVIKDMDRRDVDEPLPPFSIRQAVVCEFGNHKWVLDVKVVNGVEFVGLSKWDRHFVQFSTGEALDFRSSNKSANKQFFDELLQSKKLASTAAIKKTLEDSARNDEVIEADARRRKRKLSFSMSTLRASEVLGPPFVDINVRGHSMRVLCELKTNVLWMELTHANMEFVRKGMHESDQAGRSWSRKSSTAVGEVTPSDAIQEE